MAEYTIFTTSYFETFSSISASTSLKIRYSIHMRIAYCTNVRLPSERAHGYQVSAVCDAFIKLGHSVEIFSPFRENIVQENFSDYYNVSDQIKINHVGSCDYIKNKFFPSVMGLWMMNKSMRSLLPESLKSFDVLYTRTEALLPALLSLSIPTIMEIHRLPRRDKYGFADRCNKCVKVVCLTSPMKNELVSWGVSEDKVVVEGDAVDIDKFESLPDREGSRKMFEVEDREFVVSYAGSIKTMKLDKGVPQIIKAVDMLSSSGMNIKALIAGGPEKEAEKLKESSGENINVLGQLTRDGVKNVYSASDLLVYPAPKTSHSYFMRDTSPMKIFEYMSTGKPMICADTPPIRDVLDESVTLFYEPGNVDDLSTKIVFAMENAEEMHAMAWRAKERVKEYTWDKRMERIISCV